MMVALSRARGSFVPLVGGLARGPHFPYVRDGQGYGREEIRHGQGTDEVEQGSAKAEEGEGQDDRRQSVAEGRHARPRKPQERLAATRHAAPPSGRSSAARPAPCSSAASAP